MGKRKTTVGALCEELGITRQSLYRHVAPNGTLRPDGKKILALKPSARCAGKHRRGFGRLRLEPDRSQGER
jgi:hypothetical protein